MAIEKVATSCSFSNMYDYYVIHNFYFRFYYFFNKYYGHFSQFG